MAAVTICSDFGAQKNKVSHCFHCFPIYLPWSDAMGPDAIILLYWMLSFKPTFSLSFFTFNGLFCSSSLFCHKSGVICISEVIDISPCNLNSSLCFIQPRVLMMYSAYKLNKQGDNIQPWHTPFPVWNQSVIPCPVASWPAYRFLRRQVRWSCIPISEFSTVCGDPHSQRLWHSQ